MRLAARCGCAHHGHRGDDSDLFARAAENAQAWCACGACCGAPPALSPQARGAVPTTGSSALGQARARRIGGRVADRLLIALWNCSCSGRAGVPMEVMGLMLGRCGCTIVGGRAKSGPAKCCWRARARLRRAGCKPDAPPEALAPAPSALSTTTRSVCRTCSLCRRRGSPQPLRTAPPLRRAQECRGARSG